jgi:hypothetical protein
VTIRKKTNENTPGARGRGRERRYCICKKQRMNGKGQDSVYVLELQSEFALLF